MGRLCERPGCSEPAAVAYGMRPEDLVFWLDVLVQDDDSGTGVLCLRHADAMVVPRNWTLDDQRDPDLRLFRPPSEAVDRPRRTRRAARPAPAEQLELGVGEPRPDLDPVHTDVVATRAVEPGDSWTPAFDERDDLDGLLSARSPLLARAFRGHDRPKR